MTASIVFDFDGTLALGHGPVLAYARHVAKALDASADVASTRPRSVRPGPVAGDRFVAQVSDALTRYDAGHSDRRDGYDIVASLATAHAVTDDILCEAYRRSRIALGTELAPVSTMPDLDGFLAALGRSCRLVLATNAPEIGIDRVLEAWGVRSRFTELHFTVGKPIGLERVIARLCAAGPVLAIGDIIEFDLAPAQALGADTALVGATAARSRASVSMRSHTLAALRAQVEAWANDAGATTQRR